MDAGVLGGLVVDHDVVHRDAVLADGHRLQATAVEAQTLVLLLAEDHGLAILEDDGAVVTDGTVGDGGVGLVVEDHAVLQHFHHAGAIVLCGAGHDVGGQRRQAVQCACIEGALCAHHQLTRVEGVVDGVIRGGLGDFFLVLFSFIVLFFVFLPPQTHAVGYVVRGRVCGHIKRRLLTLCGGHF